MDTLRDLYQEVIFDHNRNPRNFGELDDANRKVEGYNPLCGDQLTVYMLVDDEGVIRKVSFNGHGCAISTASASIMTELVLGKSIGEAEQLFNRLHDMVMGKQSSGDELGKLEVLSGVKDYPARVKCATLPWHTLKAALAGDAQTVSTE